MPPGPEPYIKPLSYERRKYVFLLLVLLFVVVIPLIYLYATGYRFDFTERANLISTGGMFIAAERTGAEIYIDNELVRETRVFRRAFYAQSLEPGTHRVHVQKEGHHTWVKELPVYPHLVTEAQAFNLPLSPAARIITRWQTLDGAIEVGTSTLLASTTQRLSFATSTGTSTHVEDTEFGSRKTLFVPPEPATSTRRTTLGEPAVATSTATTTVEAHGVRLFLREGDVYARWVGPREEMPYYYCAEAFELIGTASGTVELPPQEAAVLAADEADVPELLHPIQTVGENDICEPEIKIDRRGQNVRGFVHFPGSGDFVIMTLEDGAYVVEIDDRAWQNIQPLILGTGLQTRVENDRIYVYDGSLIYEMIVEE